MENLKYILIAFLINLIIAEADNTSSPIVNKLVGRGIKVNKLVGRACDDCYYNCVQSCYDTWGDKSSTTYMGCVDDCSTNCGCTECENCRHNCYDDYSNCEGNCNERNCFNVNGAYFDCAYENGACKDACYNTYDSCYNNYCDCGEKDYTLCNPSNSNSVNCKKGYYIMNGDGTETAELEFVEGDSYTTGTLWKCEDDDGNCKPVTENIPYGYLKNEYVNTKAPYIICYLDNEGKPTCRARLGNDIKSSTKKERKREDEVQVCTEKGQLGIDTIAYKEGSDTIIDYYSSTYFFCDDSKNPITLDPNNPDSGNVEGQYFIGYDKIARENGDTYRSIQDNENGVYPNVFEVYMLNDEYSGKEFFFSVNVQRLNVVLPERYKGDENKYLYTTSGDKTLKIFVKEEDNEQCQNLSLNQFVRDRQLADPVDYYYKN